MDKVNEKKPANPIHARIETLKGEVARLNKLLKESTDREQHWSCIVDKLLSYFNMKSVRDCLSTEQVKELVGCTIESGMLALANVTVFENVMSSVSDEDKQAGINAINKILSM